MSALADVRVIEFAGIGPTAFAGSVLADMGARVLRVDRKVDAGLGAPKGGHEYNFLRRQRIDIALDLKSPEDHAQMLELVDSATVVLEGFRPGVMERLGLGPDKCLARNPSLIYARVTGWGQDGPLAMEPGHDITYIARTGVLGAIGRQGQPPSVPLTLLGDMAGGGMFAVAGILAAIIEARRSGVGQVVDVSIVDAVCNLAMSLYGRHASGLWQEERGSNYFDSGAPFYDTYECLDGQYVAVGAVERRFLDKLLQQLAIDFSPEYDHFDRAHWPELRVALESKFRQRTRDDWCRLFSGEECCVAPVLELDEARSDSQLVARKTFCDVDGVTQPSPAIRFSKTPCLVPSTPRAVPTEPGALEKQILSWLS